MDSKIAIIKAYLNHDIDVNYDQSLGTIVGQLLIYYRPGANWHTMSLATRWGMVNRLLNRFIHQFVLDELYMAEFLYLAITCLYDKEVLHTTLRHIPGMIYEDESGKSCIHEVISKRIFERDPLSARIIATKTKNLHRPVTAYMFTPDLETPTSFAMLQSTLFFGWRKLLLEIGCQTEDFIERELKEEVVVNRGWTKTSLTNLFELEFVPYIAKTSAWSFPDCERCGKGLCAIAHIPPVDLAWRRMLRSLRLGQSIDYYLHDDNSPASSGVRKLPYRIVCSRACDDGICVSQGYENDLSDEPLLPPFREKGSIIEEIKPKDLDCPTRKMPGAFV